MKKFVINLFIFNLICFCVFLGVKLLIKQKVRSNNDYLATISDKHKALLNLKGAKLIFSGGSNLVFGLNSRQIQSKFGIPVINLSMHAGLGSLFILNELKYSMKSGDVIFLSLEYLLDSNGEYKLKKHATKGFPEAANYYDIDLSEEIISEIDQLRTDFFSSFSVEKAIENRRIGPEIYSRSAFNKFGDINIRLSTSKIVNVIERPRFSYRYWEGIALLNDFYKFAHSKNVDVYFIYPCFPSSAYELNKEVIARISSDLKKDLLIEIIGNPIDFVFPDTMFFDTIYHLNSIGQINRTDKLVGLMESNSQVQNSILNIKNRMH